jgi:hypothetical protein
VNWFIVRLLHCCDAYLSSLLTPGAALMTARTVYRYRIITLSATFRSSPPHVMARSDLFSGPDLSFSSSCEPGHVTFTWVLQVDKRLSQMHKRDSSRVAGGRYRTSASRCLCLQRPTTYSDRAQAAAEPRAVAANWVRRNWSKTHLGWNAEGGCVPVLDSSTTHTERERERET